MAFDLDVVRKQIIGLMNLSARDTSGVPSYTSTVSGGDAVYADEEIDRAVDDAVSEIMRAICETEGHHHRTLFTTEQALTHEAVIPAHYGPIGVPKITPFSGAGFTIRGKVKSIEDIAAYRANPNNYYSDIAHNASSGGFASKLAGFYAIDEAAQVFYFTGYSAAAMLANFSQTDYTLLPDSYYPDADSIAIMRLKKDGDMSDIFAHHTQLAMDALNRIRSKASDQPSPKKTVGTRDTGQK